MAGNSTTILHCNECNQELGSMNIDGILSPENTMAWMARNHTYFTCNDCHTHEFDNK